MRIELLNLKAKNVFSYEELTLPLNQFYTLQIVGKNLDEKFEGEEDENGVYPSSNGTGKTSIYNVITEALYSKNLSKIKKSYIKNINSKGNFSIVLDLLIDSIPHTLTYTSSECSLKSGDTLIAVGRKSVTDFFEEIIPYDLFVSLTYMSPKFKLPFFSETDKYRKDFINKCFDDLNIYLAPIPALTEYSKELHAKLTANNQYRLMLEKDLKVVIQPKKDIPVYEPPVLATDKIEGLKKEIKDIERKLDIYKEEQLRLSQLEQQLQEYLRKRKIVDFDSKRYDEVGFSIKTLIKEKETLEKIKDYALCPTCGTELNKDQAAERYTKVCEKLSKLKEEYLPLQQLKKDWEEQKEIISKSQDLMERIENLVFTVSHIEADRLRQELEKKRNEVDSINADYNSKYEEYLKKKEEALKIRAFNEEQDFKKKRLDEVKLEIQNVDKEKESLSKEMTYIKTLLEVFSPKGLFAYKLPERLELLNEQVNSILLNFTSQFKIVFKMVKEKIEVFLLKEGQEYPVENCSEGEYTRISLALLLALRHILSISQNFSVNILFLDEIFGSLDLLGRAKLFDVLSEFKLNVLLVSHSSFYFDLPTLEIYKEKGKSKAILNN